MGAIDVVIETLRARHPGIRIEQLVVKRPTDDDGLWFILGRASVMADEIFDRVASCGPERLARAQV